MLSLSIEADMKQAQRALTKLQRHVVPKAAATALNETRTAIGSSGAIVDVRRETGTS